MRITLETSSHATQRRIGAVHRLHVLERVLEGDRDERERTEARERADRVEARAWWLKVVDAALGALEGWLSPSPSERVS